LNARVSEFPVLRNTALLAACLVALSGTVQLVVAVSTLTLVLVTGVESILGLGPAIFLVAGALAALPAGRLMDRLGRVPVIAGGFVLGAVGCAATALGCAVESGVLVGLGFAVVGASSGTVLLSRAAGADMYPPERRARGISYVLSGALFGAVLGPLVFRPLFAGKDLDPDALVVPWLAGGAIMLVGLAIVLNVRPDPQKIAYALGGGRPQESAPAPLREIVQRPGVAPALVAALVSFAVMVAVMNLTGYVMVDHGHHQADVFTVIAVHIVGMYALVLVIGNVIDRIGRLRCQLGGLAIMALSTTLLVWTEDLGGFSLSLFLLGLGWNLSYVAAAAELADMAAPHERGKLIGLSDLLSGMLGATLALVGGVVYTSSGKTTLALAATAVALGPILWFALTRKRPPAEAFEPAR
jgi:MFS family permease